jgi:hypothetical protein
VEASGVGAATTTTDTTGYSGTTTASVGLAGEKVTLLTSVEGATWDVVTVFAGELIFCTTTGCLAYSLGVYPFFFKEADNGLCYY